jgi:hypothetical protein
LSGSDEDAARAAPGWMQAQKHKLKRVPAAAKGRREDIIAEYLFRAFKIRGSHGKYPGRSASGGARFHERIRFHEPNQVGKLTAKKYDPTLP